MAVTSASRVLDDPVEVAHERVAGTLGGQTRGRDGTLTRASRRFDLDDTAWVELTPLSPGTTLLEVTADRVPPALQALLTAPASPRPPAPPAHRSRVGLVAAGVALAVAATAIVGSRVLTPPRAMDVSAAVAQFQAEQASPTTASVEAPPPSRTGGRDQGAAESRARNRSTGPRTAAATPGGGAARPSAKRADAGAGTRARGTAQVAAAPAPSPRPQRRAADQPPAPGVYTYATSGYEAIDQPGGRHDYPAETPLSVRHTDCGFTTRWQPLEQRWDEMEVCTGKARTLERMSTQREFYGQRQRSDYACEPGSRAWDRRPGARWATRCSDGETTVVTQLRVVGSEPIRVGNEVVDAVHLRLRAQLSGATTGRWTADRWLHPDTGLLVRVVSSTTATSEGPFGTIDYREEVELQLRSLTPQT